ncbi:MAG: hypothetical protein LJU34_00290 [Oscillospiraceae bacterium]|nr:hypothetical protein [Oscillospiraceae bacterium]
MPSKRPSTARPTEAEKPADRRTARVETPDFGDIDDILASADGEEEETYSLEDILSEFRDL